MYIHDMYIYPTPRKLVDFLEREAYLLKETHTGQPRKNDSLLVATVTAERCLPEIFGSFLMSRLVVNDFWTFCWPSLAYCLGDPAKHWRIHPEGDGFIPDGQFQDAYRFSIVVGIGIDTNSLDLEHILVTWWIPKGSTFQAKKPCWPLGCFWGMAFPLDFLDFLATVEKHLQTLQW